MLQENEQKCAQITSSERAKTNGKSQKKKKVYDSSEHEVIAKRSARAHVSYIVKETGNYQNVCTEVD